MVKQKCSEEQRFRIKPKKQFNVLPSLTQQAENVSPYSGDHGNRRESHDEAVVGGVEADLSCVRGVDVVRLF